jgi:hypothetical protein
MFKLGRTLAKASSSLKAEMGGECGSCAPHRAATRGQK